MHERLRLSNSDFFMPIMAFVITDAAVIDKTSDKQNVFRKENIVAVLESKTNISRAGLTVLQKDDSAHNMYDSISGHSVRSSYGDSIKMDDLVCQAGVQELPGQIPDYGIAPDGSRADGVREN